MSDNKSTYKGQTDARRRANAKYLKESVEDIKIRVPKGKKDVYKEYALKSGQSLNQYIINAIEERITKGN